MFFPSGSQVQMPTLCVWHQGGKHGLRSCHTVPAQGHPALTSCVALNKLLTFSMPQFPPQSKENNDGIYPIVFLWRINALMHMEHSEQCPIHRKGSEMLPMLPVVVYFRNNPSRDHGWGCVIQRGGGYTRMVGPSGLSFLKTISIRERTFKVDTFTESRGVKLHGKECLFGSLRLTWNRKL